MPITVATRWGSSAPFDVSAGTSGGGIDRNLDDVQNDRPSFTGDRGDIDWRIYGSTFPTELANRFSFAPIGSPGLLPRNSGNGDREPIVDNAPLEARPDVLRYTTRPLESTLEAVGPVSVELFVTASSPHFDMFARVCDVDRAGVSWNVCDALIRAAPDRFESVGDGAWRVAFALWPTAHRFATGHRIRLQVSSGAHPRYLRNPGTGEDPTIATSMEPVDIEILHDERHPSVLILPA